MSTRPTAPKASRPFQQLATHSPEILNVMTSRIEVGILHQSAAVNLAWFFHTVLLLHFV